MPPMIDSTYVPLAGGIAGTSRPCSDAADQSLTISSAQTQDAEAHDADEQLHQRSNQA